MGLFVLVGGIVYWKCLIRVEWMIVLNKLFIWDKFLYESFSVKDLIVILNWIVMCVV